MRKVLALSALVMTAVIAASPATAATVLNAGMNDGCSKSSCFNDKGVFTKTWTAAGASGPMTVGKLLLDRGVLGSLDGSMFRLSFALNGEEIGTWGSYMMGGIAGDELSFSGQNFTWNPEDGDLTLVLEIVQPKGAGGAFLRSIANPQTDEPDGNENGPPQGRPGGEEQVGIPTAVPEPVTWALMISGFGVAGASLRQRRTRVVA